MGTYAARGWPGELERKDSLAGADRHALHLHSHLSLGKLRLLENEVVKVTALARAELRLDPSLTPEPPCVASLPRGTGLGGWDRTVAGDTLRHEMGPCVLLRAQWLRVGFSDLSSSGSLCVAARHGRGGAWPLMGSPGDQTPLPGLNCRVSRACQGIRRGIRYPLRPPGPSLSPQASPHLSQAPAWVQGPGSPPGLCESRQRQEGWLLWRPAGGLQAGGRSICPGAG